jgi:hypothetical protein
MAFLNTHNLNVIQDALISRDPFQCIAAQAIVASAKDSIADPALQEQAMMRYSTDDIEIDDEAATSEADNGTWVAAWVWIARDDDEYLRQEHAA